MAAFMKKNSDEYEDIDQGALNSDMPRHVRFQCYKDMEITAMTNMLKKNIENPQTQW